MPRLQGGGAGTSKPLSNAKIEIWHAHNEGNGHPNGSGRANFYSTGDVALRGLIPVDEKGTYQFNTVYPRKYFGRARHIHLKLNDAGFPVPNTQLIMPAKAGNTLTYDEDTVSKGLPD